MKPIPNYKPLQERLQEEKEYFFKLLEKIKNNLTIPQFKDLQKYLQTNNGLVDARYYINEIDDESLKKEIRNAKKLCEYRINTLLESFLTEEEIFDTEYIFDRWIIDGKPAY